MSQEIYPLFDPAGTFPGIDYWSHYNMQPDENIVTKTGDGWQDTLLDRKTENRTPWQDIGITFTGAAVHDLSRHFVERWNAHLYEDYEIENSGKSDESGCFASIVKKLCILRGDAIHERHILLPPLKNIFQSQEVGPDSSTVQ